VADVLQMRQVRRTEVGFGGHEPSFRQGSTTTDIEPAQAIRGYSFSGADMLLAWLATQLINHVASLLRDTRN
jgi:hypothetical protein